VVYEIPEEAVTAIDAREGAPYFYRRVEGIKIKFGKEEVEAFTYVVVDKQLEEISPTKEYFDVVRNGMINHLPIEYIKKYLIEHCRNKFAMRIFSET